VGCGGEEVNKKELKQIIGKEIDRVHTRINSLEERIEKLENELEEALKRPRPGDLWP
jgi:chaperonin cofactor prefoldin